MIDKQIETALLEIKRGTSEIIDEEKIISLLQNYYTDGVNYYVKAGFDPTAEDLHLGHTVLLQKLATFQKFGGIVQFLIGDFTATIGDPTGKSETRKKLSKDDVLVFAKSYKEQVFKVLDVDKTEVVYNSNWLGKLNSYEFIELLSKRTVARMLEKDDFEKRFKSQTDIALYEFAYPLLQGYDSVYLKSDIELGGIDQKFNLLMGRYLQRSYETKKEQAILMMPLLEGLDGVNKMSKSLSNFIGICENENIMFAKIMSISDALMWKYYSLLSKITLKDIDKIKYDVENGTLHPKSVKEDLAKEIVDRYHNGCGDLAKEEFNNIFKQNNIPKDIKEYDVELDSWICKVLVECDIVESTSQAKRDIKQGAIKLDGKKVLNNELKINVGEYILQKGKKKFAKIRVTK
jgi:tyrosyl-tRNA synthetase